MESIHLHEGDCLEVLRKLEDNSVDSIVTDPPYGLSFMGKKWDYDVPAQAIWEECLRVLKPGGHLLAFAGTRTQHRMAVRIEDAGFEIRDMIAWVYGSGFPKSMDVSKAIDKAAGNGVKGEGSFFTLSGGKSNGGSKFRSDHPEYEPYKPATEAAKQWQGWGTALKPALEPITVARKPLIGTVAKNVLEYGTGGINIDGCRVGDETIRTVMNGRSGGTWDGNCRLTQKGVSEHTGRWPANLIHDGSPEVEALTGTAARFFYCAKASKKDRDEGNIHPTVKPTDLMRYLCRLVTPPGGVVLDPFMGSGSTGKAALIEGFSFIGIERDPEYLRIATARIHHQKQEEEQQEEAQHD